MFALIYLCYVCVTQLSTIHVIEKANSSIIPRQCPSCISMCIRSTFIYMVTWTLQCNALTLVGMIRKLRAT